MDWTVRRATPELAPAVREIARESWHAAYDEFLGPSQVTTMIDDWYALDGLEESIADAGDREDVSFLVAVPDDTDTGADIGTGDERSGDTAVGFAHAGILPDERSTAYLSRLYVRPSVWGDGAGTALIGRIEADVRPHCDRLRLSVLANNEIGISFYESAGFERVETHASDLVNVDGTGELEEFTYEKRL
ncbi:GNAT family N-acetyltransferase [Natrialba asiatica]|uniref:N-acetyltransferase GCN5 n=1 Tax=Natrialba asiatica (strain ATCC 700177 / DSM 12278 / JCM 9576 / FERM P-10747 / NBRC 102637 / 172P1) TaxID=29540 RepID=M0B0Y9_NATA1|nr:GNAT family N-acetyltransferase [Natrialba asiatica]ELZ03903.1 N-acetyltransferase GCN5 [Natrialba asiatica DSM 12278]